MYCAPITVEIGTCGIGTETVVASHGLKRFPVSSSKGQPLMRAWQRLMTLQRAYYEVLGQNAKLTSNTKRVLQEIG